MKGGFLQSNLMELLGGRIEIILGPMFSGKTTELVRRARRLMCAGLSCVIVKYKMDVRYSQNNLSTHDKTEMQALCAKNLRDIDELIHGFQAILIDEGQFYSDLLEFCEKWANNGK